LISDEIAKGTQPKTASLPGAIQQNWMRLARSGIRQEAYERLLAFAAAPSVTTAVDTRPLHAQSLRYFLDFWEMVKGKAREPDLVLSPSGTLQAEWHLNWRKHLEIEFCEDGRAHFGLFSGKTVYEGYDGVTSIAKMLLERDDQPLKWGETH
jgi:hypothetical protein